MINWPENIDYIITCDLETTGTDTHGSEWITGSFGKLDAKTLETIDELELTSRPEFWGPSAEEARYIHRISSHTAFEFSPRGESLQRMINFLPPKGTFAFACHASESHKSAAQGWKKVFMHFDLAILKWDFLEQGRWFEFYEYFSDQMIISSTQICREYYGHDKKMNLKQSCAALGMPMKGDHHNARDDRKGCESILRKYKHETNPFNVGERSSKLNPPIPEIQENIGLEEQQRFGL